LAKVLLIGQGKLPPELSPDEAEKISAPSIRAWHWAKAISEAGHSVKLISIHPSTSGNPAKTINHQSSIINLQPVNESEITSGGLQKICDEFAPDAIVGVSVWASYLAALYAPENIPLWGDLFGSPLAEGQAKAVVTGDDSVIEPFARFERAVLRRADKISTVSRYQDYATIGAVATHGRLNRHTDGYRFTSVIPATLDPTTLPPASEKFLRGKVVPDDAFVVLWSGGFNTWTDIATLFEGLEKAMAQNRRLHFVSTGGALPPHDAQTYPRFENLVANSAYRERFHLLGWRPFAELHNYYLESDIGIILDRWSYEGLLGSRTRLLDWALYGLPAVVTVTAELTEELTRNGLAYSFPHGNALALAGLLARLANEPSLLQEAKTRTPDFVKSRYGYIIACKSLLDWLQNPHRAPDAGQELPALGTATDTALERQLTAYRAQIEAKNVQISELESWAHDLESRLQARNGGLFAKLKSRFKSAIMSKK
jgi:glycosyltransferase involved in cell wall biosynthesis